MSDIVHRVTPKAFFISILKSNGVSSTEAEEAWLKMQGFCMREVKETFPHAEYAALVFDGEGGTVIGADQHEEGCHED